MLSSGPAKKVSVYVREDQKYHGNATYVAVLDFLFYRNIAGATVTRGVAGFGADHHLHTARLVDVTPDLPIKVEFIESAEKIEELMPKLYEIVGEGLIEMQDTEVVKPARVTHSPEPAPARKVSGGAKLMRIYLSERDRWGVKPLYEAIVEALRANDIAGVTVHAGIMGFGPRRRIYHEHMVDLSHDRPMMLAVVDSEEKLRAFMPILDQMVQDGLVVMSDADVIKYTHDYIAEERREASRS